MKLFAGKTPNERNKMIAAIVLGVLALFALFMAFGPNISGSKVTVTAKGSPTPALKSSASVEPNKFDLPTQQEQAFDYETTPIEYNGGDAYAPAAGRNIFAFYEPPPPTPYSPTPFVPADAETRVTDTHAADADRIRNAAERVRRWRQFPT